jgi:hypothetical protein
MDWTGVQYPAGATTSRQVLRPPIQWIPESHSSGVKQPRHEADHSPPSGAEVKKEWSCTSTTPYVFIAWGLISTKDNFTFTLIYQQWYSCPATRHEGAWGKRRHSSYSFSASALDRGEWWASHPGRALPPGRGPLVPTEQEAGWAPEPVWTQRLEEKSSAPVGDRTSGRPVRSQSQYWLSYSGCHLLQDER